MIFKAKLDESCKFMDFNKKEETLALNPGALQHFEVSYMR